MILLLLTVIVPFADFMYFAQYKMHSTFTVGGLANTEATLTY